MNKNEYMVLVRCMTYNQSKYILDALNGFVMQKTNFPFACLVMDDASTDGEQEVIKGFLDRECAMESAEISETEDANIVVVPHKTNSNCTMAVYFLKKNLYGTDKKTSLIGPWREKCKYEAMCEGDDYWTNPEKIQKQVSLLEKNPKCGLCYSNCDVYYERENRWERAVYKDQPKPIDEENPFFPSYYYCANMTWVYRTEFCKISSQNTQYIDGALFLLYSICLNHELAYLAEVTGVYRRHEGSDSCFSQEDSLRMYRYEKNSFLLRASFAMKFQKKELILRRLYSENLCSLLVRAYALNDTEIINQFDTYFKEKLDIGLFVDELTAGQKRAADFVKSSVSFKVGHMIVRPISMIISLFKR